MTNEVIEVKNMNVQLFRDGEQVATIAGTTVTCDDNKLHECLLAIVNNYETSTFPAHLNKDDLLFDSIKGFCSINGIAVERA